MKKYLVLAFTAMMCSNADMNAQAFLKGLADKAKDKVKEKIEKKVDNTVGNAADKVLNGKSKGGKSEAKPNGKTMEFDLYNSFEQVIRSSTRIRNIREGYYNTVILLLKIKRR